MRCVNKLNIQYLNKPTHTYTYLHHLCLFVLISSLMLNMENPLHYTVQNVFCA